MRFREERERAKQCRSTERNHITESRGLERQGDVGAFRQCGDVRAIPDDRFKRCPTGNGRLVICFCRWQRLRHAEEAHAAVHVRNSCWRSFSGVRVCQRCHFVLMLMVTPMGFHNCRLVAAIARGSRPCELHRQHDSEQNEYQTVHLY